MPKQTRENHLPQDTGMRTNIISNSAAEHTKEQFFKHSIPQSCSDPKSEDRIIDTNCSFISVQDDLLW